MNERKARRSPQVNHDESISDLAPLAGLLSHGVCGLQWCVAGGQAAADQAFAGAGEQTVADIPGLLVWKIERSNKRADMGPIKSFETYGSYARLL